MTDWRSFFFARRGLARTLLTLGAAKLATRRWQAGGRNSDEEDRGGDETLQTPGSEGSAARGRTAGDHGYRSQGLRTAERASRTLSRGRIRRRFSLQGEDRDCT